jgi:hypothetical protein
MLCQHCRGVTLQKLLDLEARQRNDEDYIFEDVPKEFSLPHQPSFASLLNSASKGCRFCNAIRWEFETYGFTHKLLEMEEDGLGTRVRMCIATWDKESEAPEMQLLDRILVRAGDINYESSEEDESEEYEDQSQESIADDVSSSDSNTSEESQSLEGYTIKLGLGRHKGEL